MDAPDKPTPAAPPLLEQLGALGSLLIHDMANQMCIISGNATFAQMMQQDPEQLGRAIDAINKSSERMSFILGQCAELRRRLGGEMPRGDAAEVVGALQRVLSEYPEWTLEMPEAPTGSLAVPSTWIRFSVVQILAEAASPRGTLRVRRFAADPDTTFLPGGTYLEIRCSWESARPFSIDELRVRFENFGLLAAFELTRQCGGRLEGLTPSPGRQEAFLCVPFAYDIVNRCSA